MANVQNVQIHVVKFLEIYCNATFNY